MLRTILPDCDIVYRCFGGLLVRCGPSGEDNLQFFREPQTPPLASPYPVLAKNKENSILRFKTNKYLDNYSYYEQQHIYSSIDNDTHPRIHTTVPRHTRPGGSAPQLPITSLPKHTHKTMVAKKAKTKKKQLQANPHQPITTARTIARGLHAFAFRLFARISVNNCAGRPGGRPIKACTKRVDYYTIIHTTTKYEYDASTPRL